MNPPVVPTISPKELEEILLHFSQSMTEIDSEEELLWDLVSNCISKLHFEDAVVYLLDESGEFLEQKAALGPKSQGNRQILNSLKIPVGKGVTGKVASSGFPILIADTRFYPDYIQDDQPRLAEVAVPILLEGKVIGVIDSENSTPNYFSEQHVRILNAVASVYSGHIARIRAERKVREKQEILLQLEKRNFEFQLDALAARLSPHFVFNSLNSIQHQIFKEDKETSLRFLGIFSKLLRYFLNQLKEKEALLKDEIQMIKWYLELQQLRYGTNLSFEILNLESISQHQRKFPSMVIQNLIENLLEEQIQKANGNINISIEFSESENQIHLKVWINQAQHASKVEKRANGPGIAPPWREFIEILNEIRPYKIHYDSGERDCPEREGSCKYVHLIFPNLS